MFRIVRNNITQMDTEAIVNTTSAEPEVSTGCDMAVYKAAGYEELLAYRREKIGFVPEGDVFVTPGFRLPAKYIIHAVSPLYIEGDQGVEAKLRSCYRKSLQLAKENHVKSIAFPLIATGSFRYPQEEGMRIAVDEINAFLLGAKNNEMEIFLVVFSDEAPSLGERIAPDLEEYIDENYVDEKLSEEYEEDILEAPRAIKDRYIFSEGESVDGFPIPGAAPHGLSEASALHDIERLHENKLDERMQHLSDTFSQYLMYLIHDKKMENADVYKRAIVDKKIFSKIKNNTNYHPQKLTALCLCVGAKLNLDEAKDLLARAGYALSPCDKIDVIFSYFIENEIYDMIELDIQLEKHGLPCIIA